MTAALLIIALLTAEPSPLERISLLAINAEGVSAEELEQLYPVLEAALRKRSGACVVSQREIARLNASGQKLDSLQLCGRPLNEPSRVTHVVAARLGTGQSGYVFSLELFDIPRTERVGGGQVASVSHADLLAQLPMLVTALLADVPRAPVLDATAP